MKYKELYNSIVKRLSEAGITDAQSDTRLLFDYLLGIDRGRMFMLAEDEADEESVNRILNAVKVRENRIPLQHITGVQEFMGFEFNVTEDVLIPRFDTECLVEEAMLVCNDGDKVLDVCTGSGCILISLMNYKNDIKGYGCDISAKALDVARINAEKLCKPNADNLCMNMEIDYVATEKDGLHNPCFIESDLFSNIHEKDFDIIVSNPPYIRSEVIDSLEPEVKEHDPILALDGGEDGLVFYRRLTEESGAFLRKGGSLLVEIGYDQAEDVAKLFCQNGFSDVKVIKDLAGNDRVVRGVFR